MAMAQLFAPGGPEKTKKQPFFIDRLAGMLDNFIVEYDPVARKATAGVVACGTNQTEEGAALTTMKTMYGLFSYFPELRTMDMARLSGPFHDIPKYSFPGTVKGTLDAGEIQTPNGTIVISSMKWYNTEIGCAIVYDGEKKPYLLLQLSPPDFLLDIGHDPLHITGQATQLHVYSAEDVVVGNAVEKYLLRYLMEKHPEMIEAALREQGFGKEAISKLVQRKV